MAAATLVDQDIRDGEALVRKLDRDRFPVTAAFWYRDTEDEKWRLIIESAVVGAHGPLEAYRRLGKSMKRIKKAGRNGFDLDSFRVQLVAVKEMLPSLLRRAVKTGHGIAGIRFAGNVIGGNLVGDAYIYRLE